MCTRTPIYIYINSLTYSRAQTFHTHTHTHTFTDPYATTYLRIYTHFSPADVVTKRYDFCFVLFFFLLSSVFFFFYVFILNAIVSGRFFFFYSFLNALRPNWILRRNIIIIIVRMCARITCNSKMYVTKVSYFFFFFLYSQFDFTKEPNGNIGDRFDGCAHNSTVLLFFFMDVFIRRTMRMTSRALCRRNV